MLSVDGVKHMLQMSHEIEREETTAAVCEVLYETTAVVVFLLFQEAHV